MVYALLLLINLIESVIIIKICNMPNEHNKGDLIYEHIMVLFLFVILCLRYVSPMKIANLLMFCLEVALLLFYQWLRNRKLLGNHIFYSLIGATFIYINELFILLFIVLNLSIEFNLNYNWLLVLISPRFFLVCIWQYMRKVSLKQQGWYVNYLIIFVFLTCISTMIVLGIAYSGWIQKVTIYLLIWILGIVIGISLMVLFVYLQDKETIQYLEQYQYLQERAKLYLNDKEEAIALYEKMHHIQHDLKNHITIIKALSTEKEVFGLAEEYSSSLKETLYQKISNQTLFYILKSKSNRCKEKGIILNLYIFDDCSFMDDVDLVTMFSNLLDNAIEAQKTVKKERWISIWIQSTNFGISIIVQNAISSPVLENNKELHTTKKDKIHHGIGLKSIRYILKKYDGDIFFKEYKGMFEVACLLFNIKGG